MSSRINRQEEELLNYIAPLPWQYVLLPPQGIHNKAHEIKIKIGLG